MAVSTRFLYVPLLLLVVALGGACSGGGSNGDDDTTPTIDSGVTPQDCPNCAAPNECCEINGGHYCLSTTSDVSNCGGCGLACDPARANACGGSQCKCGFASQCEEGQNCCADGCKDFMTDEQNCGGCGPAFACGAGATCEGGLCSCGGMQCQAGEMCCNNVCTNTQTDPTHCGGCSAANVCSGMTSSCNAGTCGCPGGGGACPAAMQGVVPMCCGTGCLDVCASTTDCGACGHACVAGDICIFGACFGAGEDPIAGCLPF